MRLLTRRKTPTEELKDAAIRALVNALDDDKRAAKPGTKGVRALAAGAVIYTAGHAAFKGQRFLREQLLSDTEDDQETRAYEEPRAEEYEVDEENDEPEAYEEDDEPEAVEEDDKPEARREPDDESRSETPTPLPERKPMRRAARKKSAQPSLKLPKQRRARTRMSKD